MNKKEKAMHILESELDSIAQSIYCSKECASKCPYLRRIHKLQGAARIIMDYGHAPKNTTLTTFQIMKWGAGRPNGKHCNHRIKKQPEQKEL